MNACCASLRCRSWRCAIGDAARAYVEQRTDAGLSGRGAAIAWYRDLWSRRDELTEALLARLVAVRDDAETAIEDRLPTDAVV